MSTCKDCRFFFQFDDTTQALLQNTDGDCRRFPPSLMISNGQEPYLSHPEMSFDEWCGEFQQAPTPERTP